uniref:FAR1 domain-containing protein n=1 Tax=Lactuca sativa TaxID=4236 RepID=A0A9R1UG98_LACSA|nr:hypothetical protein LSAT_V11C900498240 [Lactuca sativa]
MDQHSTNIECTMHVDDAESGKNKTTNSESNDQVYNVLQIINNGSMTTNIGSLSGNVESSSYCIRDPIMRIINRKTYWILDVDMRPYKGQTFPTFEDGLAFYKEYARKSGFETGIGSTKTVKGVEGYERRYIVCNRQGSKKKFAYDTLTDSNNNKHRRPFIRVNCEAYVRMKANNSNIKEEHTHMFVYVEDKNFLNSERRLTFSQKKIIYDMLIVNMGPSAAYKYMKESIDGCKKIEATRTDTKFFKRHWIEFIREKDANFMIDKLKKKKAYLQYFSFDYSIGSNGELSGLCSWFCCNLPNKQVSDSIIYLYF